MIFNAVHTIPTDVDEWVEAHPFRVHLRYLMSVSGMSSSNLALLAGVSPRLASNLIYGRNGRALRRISPDTARQLLQVTADEARAVRLRTVPAQVTAGHLRHLRTAGWSAPELARLLCIPPDQLTALIGGAAADCTQLVALRAATEVALLRSPLSPSRRPLRAAAWSIAS